MSKRLYDCTTAVERLEWVKDRLSSGHIVSENTLVLGGVASPHAVIAGLRATGMQIEQIAIDHVDAKGSMHRGATAWRLLQFAMPQESPKSARQRTNATIKHRGVLEMKTEA